MEVKLTVKQRIDLQSILPRKADFLTIKMIRVLREDLSFTQKEHDLLKFVNHPNGLLEWNAKTAKKCIKEFKIPETIVPIVKESLEKLNASKQITEAHLDFYEMFMNLPTSDKEKK